MNTRGRKWLLLGADVCFFIAILHVVMVIIGPSAYSYFGGARLARIAVAGSSSPAVQILSLAAVHFIFGIYALSGAGVIRRLPCLAIGLLVIGGLYAFRGLSIINQTLQFISDPGSIPIRVLLYSLVALVTGCAYFVGTVQSWERLHAKEDQGGDKFTA